tara:strand:- start:1517 stop:1630 length:114 start_codon:yes stop_codon:yes gene_type:complete
MDKLKARHITEAAKPQGRVFLVALSLCAVFLFVGSFF